MHSSSVNGPVGAAPPQAVGGRPDLRRRLESYFWATSRRCQASNVFGVTRLANRSSVLRPSRLPLVARRRRWPSLKRGFVPNSSLRTRISSCKYSITPCWLRFIQPATQITKKANGFIATEWQRHLRFASVHCHCQTRQKTRQVQPNPNIWTLRCPLRRNQFWFCRCHSRAGDQAILILQEPLPELALLLPKMPRFWFDSNPFIILIVYEK
jgi:hypothetical protein